MLFLGFDTGGTYTDAVIFDPGANRVLASAKSLTTKQDLSIGLRKAMELVLPSASREISLVSLSTTLATNALVEGQGSPICLLLIGYDQGSLKRADLGRALGTILLPSSPAATVRRATSRRHWIVRHWRRLFVSMDRK